MLERKPKDICVMGDCPVSSAHVEVVSSYYMVCECVKQF